MKFKNLRNWHYKPISSITETITDYVANGSFATLKEDTEYVASSKFILIRLVDYNNNFNGEFKYITKESYEFLDKTKLFGGEIIISNVGANAGTVFKTPYLKYKMSLGPNSIVVKTKENDDFYYYWFKSIYGQFSLDSIKTGSAQPKFNKTDFRKLLVPVPDILEQNRIANILNNLDGKIEVNNKIIANLEEQVQAIFKSWFIDFEPFQDGNFVEIELGLIPEGWEVREVKDICELKIGRTPPRKESEWFSDKKGIKWVSIKDMGNSDMYISDTTEFLTEEAIDKFNIPLVEENTLILSFKLTVGRIAITSEKICTNEAIAQFKNPIINSLYLYFYFKNFSFETLGNTSSNGNAVNSKIIRETKILIPNNKVLDQFLKSVKPISDFIRTLLNQNKKLAEIRDALLPSLMAGEIDVSNIKIKGEEVKNE